MLPLADAIPADIDPMWLPAGVALQLASSAVRSRAWFNILRLSYPQADLRARDVLAASFAGAGINAVVPARGGDLVKFAFVRRRIAGAHYATLIATALPETIFESLCAAALIAWLLVRGLLPMPTAPSAETVPLLLAALVIAIAVLRALSRRGSIAEHVRQGLAMCSSPRRYVTQVASWQALARLARLGSLASFLAAFGLPATLDAALLVMAAQGGGRVVPIAPVSAGLRIAALSYGLASLSAQPADPALIAAFTLGTSATLLAVTLPIATALVLRELGTCSPWGAIQQARGLLFVRPRRHAV